MGKQRSHPAPAAPTAIPTGPVAATPPAPRVPVSPADFGRWKDEIGPLTFDVANCPVCGRSHGKVEFTAFASERHVANWSAVCPQRDSRFTTWISDADAWKRKEEMQREADQCSDG